MRWTKRSRRSLRMSAWRARPDEAKGAGAAELGQIDPQLESVNTGYRIGATRVNAQKHALQTVSQFQQMANDPSNELFNTPPQDGLLSKADQYFRQQLGGLENDPVSAKAITPLIQHAMNELAGQRVQRQVQDTQKQALNNAVSQATFDLQNGGSTFSYSDQFDTMKKLYGGDGVAANKALSQSVIDAAYTQHSLAMLNLIPKTITDANGNTVAGPAMAPDTEQKLNEARTAITRLVDQDGANTLAQAKFGTMKQYDDMLSQGIPVPAARLKQDMSQLVAGKPLVSADEANDYYQQGTRDRPTYR